MKNSLIPSVLGEYWVVGVDIEQYAVDLPERYLKGLLKEDTDPLAQRGFRSYLGVVPSPPQGFDNFTVLVNAYMEKPPFNFPNPLGYFGGMKRVTFYIINYILHKQYYV